MAHDAFITYGWAEGTAVASTLQRAISTIGTPWYGSGKLSVHLDSTDTEPSGSLRSDLFAELDNSRYLILLASRKAARSRWVEREVGHWLSGAGTAPLGPEDPPPPINRLILVLLDGTIEWGRDDFDWSRTDCLPRALSGRYTRLPPVIDLRWAVGREDLSVHDPDFRAEAASITARVLGTSRRELLRRDVAEHRGARRTALSAIGALAASLVVALVIAGVAIVNGRAETRAHHQAAADLRAAAAQAFLRDAVRLRATDPGRALQTALAAHYLTPGPDTSAALTEALRATPFAGADHTNTPADAAVLGPKTLVTRAADGALTGWSRDPLRKTFHTPATGTVLAATDALVALGGPAGVRLWDPAGQAAGTVPFTGVTALRFSPEGRILATGGSAGQVRFWDVSTPSAPAQVGDVIGGGAEPVTALAFGRDLLAYARSGTVRIWRLTGAEPTAQLATVGDLTGVTDLAFSPDGTRLAVTTAAGVRLVDVSEPSSPGTPVAVRAPAGTTYGTLAWSADGKRLAAGGTNGTVTVWDAATRAAALTTSVQKGTVLAVTFDDAALLSVAADGSVVRWDVTAAPVPDGDAALISEACRRAGGPLPRDTWKSYAPGVEYHDTCAP